MIRDRPSTYVILFGILAMITFVVSGLIMCHVIKLCFQIQEQQASNRKEKNHSYSTSLLNCRNRSNNSRNPRTFSVFTGLNFKMLFFCTLSLICLRK